MVTLICFFSIFILISWLLIIIPLRGSMQKSAFAFKFLVGMSILFPIIALGIYALLGSAPEVQAVLRKQAALARLEQLHQALGTPTQVIEAMRQHLKQHPDSAQGWFLLGRLYLATQQYELATAAFQKASALQPQQLQIKK